MLHGVLIALHAATGFLALAAGAVAVRNGRFFDVYLWSLIGMALFLVLAVGAEWAVIDTGARLLFAAFGVLAAVMVWRAVLARRIRPAGMPSPGYVEHVGFTLVGLFDAFAVIAVLNAGAPIWLVVGTGVLIAVAGHFAIRSARRALSDQRRPEPLAHPVP